MFNAATMARRKACLDARNPAPDAEFDYIGPPPGCILYKKLVFLPDCPGEPETCVWFKNDTLMNEPPTDEEIMALTPIAAPKPAIDCEVYCSRFVNVDAESGVTDGTSLLDYILANDPGDGAYETLGAIDPATDKVVLVNLAPRPEDGEDLVLVDGFAQGGYSYGEENGAWSDAAGATIEISKGCNFLGQVKLTRKFNTKTGEAVTGA